VYLLIKSLRDLEEKGCLMFFIAEIGVNFNGDIKIAKEMIQSAKSIGCSAVKFQTFKADNLVSKLAPKVDYQKLTSDVSETHYEMIKSFELTEEMHSELFDFCKITNIEFISTAYDPNSVNFLKNLGVKKIKTASADLIDLSIHKKIVECGLEPIVAVGMASFEEISQTMEVYKGYINQPTLLHCVSNYPCKHSSINLSVLEKIKKIFGTAIGYSDHSIGSEAAMLSVAYGASVIEKHFTLDKSMKGPDHIASSTPDEMFKLINDVNLAIKIIGKPQKTLQEEEKGMYNFSRKSIFTKSRISIGDEFTEDNIYLLRPGNGIPANEYDLIIGKKCMRDLPAFSMLERKDVEA
jgi:N,N'-diacetyllegionaminate synthase